MKIPLLSMGMILGAFNLFAQGIFPDFRNSAFMDAQMLAERNDKFGELLSTSILDDYFVSTHLKTQPFETLYATKVFFENPFKYDYYGALGEDRFNQALEELRQAFEENKKEKQELGREKYELLKVCRPDLPADFDSFVIDSTLVIRKPDDQICINSQIYKKRVKEEHYDVVKVCKPDLPSAFSDFLDPEIILEENDFKCYRELEKAKIRRKGIPETKYDLLKNCIPELPEKYADFRSNHTIKIADQDYLCFMVAAGWTTIEESKNCYFDPISTVALDLDGDGIPDCGEVSEYDLSVLPELMFPIRINDAVPDEESIEHFFPSVGPSASPMGLTSMLVDGTAKFLVERVQLELTLAFYDKMMERLNKYPELQQLFPNTYLILKNQEYFRVPSMGQVWLGAFETDIKGFVPNFQKMVNSDPQYDKIKDDMAFQVLGVVYTVGEAINKSRTFVDVVEELSPLAQTDNVIGRSIQFLQFLISNLSEIDENDNLKLVSSKSFSSLRPLAKEYFVALVYMNQETLLGKFSISNTSLGELFETNYKAISHQVSELLRLIDSFEEQVNLLKEAKNSPNPSKTDLRNQRLELVDLGFETLDFGLSMTHFSDPQSYHSGKLHQFLDDFSTNVRNVTVAIEEDKLGLAFLHTLHTVVPILETRIENLIVEMADSTKSVLDKKIERLKKVTHFINFYGGFMVDILNAQSADQVKELLKKYAQPVGSYRIKRRSSWAVELNAFPGVYSGWEFNDESNGGTGGVTGITAPLGFSVSKGHRGFSYSLFVPVIDIGAAFSYRWNSSNDTQGFPEDISWEQILSPGVHFVFGLKKIPISLMAGGQYTPRLRGISDDMLDLQPEGVWRFGFSAVVDIPIAKFLQKNANYINKE